MDVVWFLYIIYGLKTFVTFVHGFIWLFVTFCLQIITVALMQLLDGLIWPFYIVSQPPNVTDMFVTIEMLLSASGDMTPSSILVLFGLSSWGLCVPRWGEGCGPVDAGFVEAIGNANSWHKAEWNLIRMPFGLCVIRPSDKFLYLGPLKLHWGLQPKFLPNVETLGYADPHLHSWPKWLELKCSPSLSGDTFCVVCAA